MTNLNLRPRSSHIEFPRCHAEAHRQTLERLYERKATLEALIESLEEYARCRVAARIRTIPLRGA